jgi:hypothetical protein
MKTFEECLSIVERIVPKMLSKNPEFSVLLKLLAYSLEMNYKELDRIDNAYNVDFVDKKELPKLADTVGIEYPIGGVTERLRLLLKYYGKIIKNRGTEKSIKQLVRILEYDEVTLYNMSLEDYSDVEVLSEGECFIKILFDGITDFDYAHQMLRKVVPAGYRFEIANKNGPIVKGFDGGSLQDTSVVNIIVSDTFELIEHSLVGVETYEFESLDSSHTIFMDNKSIYVSEALGVSENKSIQK